MTKRTDYTGQRFGKLTVVELDHMDGVFSYWKCKCDCGNIRIASKAALEHYATACTECANKNKGWRSQIKRGFNLEELNKQEIVTEKEILQPKPTLRKEYGYSQMHMIYLSYKEGARRRDLEFKLNEDQFKEITSSKCFFCGSLPSRIKKTKTRYGEYKFNGIDRIDSDKGYTIENCIPCCTRCNIMKSNIGMEDFISWIVQIYHHLFPDITEK